MNTVSKLGLESESNTSSSYAIRMSEMMSSAISPNENTAVTKFGAQQQFDKNGQESHHDKSHQGISGYFTSLE